MKNKFIVVFALLNFGVIFSVHTQNLIPNPSFENFSACPQGIHQLNLAIDWRSADRLTTSSAFQNPNFAATPDLLSSCTQTSVTLVYDTLISRTSAKAGETFAGVVTNQEYIQARLNCTLTAGWRYHFSMWVKLPYWIGLGIDKFGAHFSEDLPSTQFFSTLAYLEPQVESDTLVNDKFSWEKIEGSFIAEGGEQYITIGCFREFSELAITSIEPTWRMPNVDFSDLFYYFIDDVSLVLLEDIGLTLKKDCQYDNTNRRFIANSINNASFYWYQWTPDSTSPDSLKLITQSNLLIDSITQTTSYIVTDSVCFTDTFTIFGADEKEALKILPEDTAICPGDTVTLLTNYDLNLEQHVWSTGDTTQKLIVGEPGTFVLEVGEGPCLRTLEVVIKDNRVIENLSLEDSICLSEKIQLSFPNNRVSWLPSVPSLAEDSLTYVLSPSSTTTYQLSYEDDCSNPVDTNMTITVKNCTIFIPNAFSPDGDNRNDLFQITSGLEYDQIELTIYDRFGKKIYTQTGLSPSWDGTFKGKEANSGVYVYSAVFTDSEKGVTRLTGNLTLIR